MTFTVIRSEKPDLKLLSLFSVSVCFYIFVISPGLALSISLPEKDPRKKQQRVLSVETLENAVHTVARRLEKLETMYGAEKGNDPYVDRRIQSRIVKLRSTLQGMMDRLDKQKDAIAAQKEKQVAIHRQRQKQATALRSDELVASPHVRPQKQIKLRSVKTMDIVRDPAPSDPAPQKPIDPPLTQAEKKEWAEVNMYLPFKKPEVIPSDRSSLPAPPPPTGRNRRERLFASPRIGKFSPPARRPDPRKQRRDRSGKAPAKKYVSVEDGNEQINTSWSSAQIQSAKKRCEKLLKGKDVKFRYLPPVKKGVCGTAAPIKVMSIEGVGIAPGATLNCKITASLHHWVKTAVQPQANKLLGSRVARLSNVSSYRCRNRYGQARARISEHAYANALDIARFQLKNGKSVSLLDHWYVGDERSDFLKNLHNAACKGPFGTVLGPEANAAHKDHFHLDGAKRRRSAYCQ